METEFDVFQWWCESGRTKSPCRATHVKRFVVRDPFLEVVLSKRRGICLCRPPASISREGWQTFCELFERFCGASLQKLHRFVIYILNNFSEKHGWFVSILSGSQIRLQSSHLRLALLVAKTERGCFSGATQNFLNPFLHIENLFVFFSVCLSSRSDLTYTKRNP